MTPEILKKLPVSYHSKARMHTCTAERFSNMLDMLYPADWNFNETSESFRYPEPIVDGIFCTLIRIRVEDLNYYFECYSTRSTKHQELVNAALSLLKETETIHTED